MNDKISTKTIISAIMFGKNKPLEHSFRKIVSTNDIEFYNRYLDEAFFECYYNKDSKIMHRITHFKKILDSQKFLIMSGGSIMLQNPSKFVFKVTL
jgi:hypothetical protein